MVLPGWNGLSVRERRSPRLRYERIREEINDITLTLGEPEEEVTTRDISITVNDGTDPVKSASVAIGQITGTTGNAGGCTLQGVADGEQTITVTADGFEEYSNTITVGADSTSFTISLTAAQQEVTPGAS